jgi:hypothetical protein
MSEASPRAVIAGSQPASPRRRDCRLKQGAGRARGVFDEAAASEGAHRGGSGLAASVKESQRKGLLLRGNTCGWADDGRLKSTGLCC